MEVQAPIEFKDGELRCPRCFGKDIVPSFQKGFLDRLMRRWERIPKHCRSCGKRFYARIEPWPAAETANEKKADG